MEYPVAVVEKAKRMGILLQRVAAGELLAEVCADLEVMVDEQRLAKLQAKYEAGGCRWEALLDGRYGHERKAHSALREWLYQRKAENESLRAPKLVEEIRERFGVELTDGHVNYLLRKREMTAPPGRPFKQHSGLGEGKQSSAETVPEPAPETSEAAGQAGLFFPRSSEAGDGSQGGA